MISRVVNKCGSSCPDSELYLVLFGAMSEGLNIRVKASSINYGLEAELFHGKAIVWLPRKNTVVETE